MGESQSGSRSSASTTRSVGGPNRALTDYPSALIEVTLERVIASATFRRSQRHREFLVHIVRAGLAGRHDQLKEVIIGLEVFGRDVHGYDPRRDPIVRVEAGRIRDKLARFYGGEGAGESFEIVIPIGSYLPQFARRRIVGPSGALAHSLAVIPFANLSGDPDDAAFLLGLADQLIDTVGRVPALKVVARQSASKAHEGGSDLKNLGKLLAVNHVIEGSLQRRGSRIRCIAHLSRTRDSVRIWSQRFDHDSELDEDLFDFQDAIADSVLAAFEALQMAPAGEGRAGGVLSGLRPNGTDNREARDFFERARYMSQQRTLEGYGKAIALLERAVALDPIFAQAHSHLGVALVNLAALMVAPTSPSFDRAKRAAQRALELDPLDGEARALLGTILFRIDRRWEEAEPAFHEALRLSPNSTLVHSSFAWCLVFNGRFDEAMRHVELGRELDPLNLGLRANNAAIAKFARRYDLAIKEFDEVLELEPRHLYSHVMLGMTYVSMREPARALPHFERACELAPSHPSPQFARIGVHGLRNDIERGRRELDALLERLGDGHYSRFNLATVQATLRDDDGVFTSLEYAASARDILYASLPAHALFEPLRSDPRYLDLLDRTGLKALPANPLWTEPSSAASPPSG